MRACALHAILVVGAVSRALGRAVHLSASAEHAVVGQALVASSNVRVNVCACVRVNVCARVRACVRACARARVWAIIVILYRSFLYIYMEGEK